METMEATRKGVTSKSQVLNLDPHDELCIIGGADVLEDEECGPLDTPRDEADALWDRRLYKPITDGFVGNVDAYGIIVPVVVAKRGEVYAVVAGRRRVRGARRVNALRMKRGEPILRVPCILRRVNDLGLMGAKFAENANREDDSPMEKIENLKDFMSRGVALEDAVVAFGVPVSMAKQWLAFDDLGTEDLKKRLAAGEMSLQAAIEFARLRSPEAQTKALEALDADTDVDVNGKRPKVSVAKARAAAKKTKKPGANQRLTVEDAKDLFELISKMPHPNASKETLSWWEGVEDMLRFLLGVEGEMPGRLVDALGKARAAAKDAAKEKAKKKTTPKKGGKS